MSERKVLQKYYDPSFDPSLLKRTKRPKDAGPKRQTVRLMMPCSVQCLTCGEWIPKARKFNAQKEDSMEKYYNITIYRFWIRCSRCSASISFKTDPKHMDYEVESGAKRNFEVWRKAKLAEETEEERLDRLEREEAERDVMGDLESKVIDAKKEMEISDALDSIRARNARIERASKEGKEADGPVENVDELRQRQDEEDAEAARKAFEKQSMLDLGEEVIDEDMDNEVDNAATEVPVPVFQKKSKEKKDYSAALGIKKKFPVPALSSSKAAEPAKPTTFLAGYDSDDD